MECRIFLVMEMPFIITVTQNGHTENKSNFSQFRDVWKFLLHENRFLIVKD